MNVPAPPVLVLQPDVHRLPFGGAWWPDGDGLSRDLLDLAVRWPAELPSIVGYVFLPVDWDATPAPEAQLRTRTLVLTLSDRSSCRMMLIPSGTPPDVARSLLAQASDPLSQWRRSDFDGAFAEAAGQ